MLGNPLSPLSPPPPQAPRAHEAILTNYLPKVEAADRGLTREIDPQSGFPAGVVAPQGRPDLGCGVGRAQDRSPL